MVPASERLFSRAFVMLTAATTCYFLALGVVTLVLPHYIAHTLGHGNLAVGLVVGSFSVSAVLTRPLAGRLGNSKGRRVLMIAGAALAASSFALYSVSTSLAGLVACRLFTGIGEGLFYTGSATIVTDLAPVDRTGEAISLYSAAIWIGNGLGPLIGQYVYRSEGPRFGFLVAAGLASLATAISYGGPRAKPVALGTKRQPLISKRALGPGAVIALGVAGSTAFNAYVPLYSDVLHMGGAQFVFLLYALIVLTIRVFFAKVPDRWGAMTTGTVATVSMAVGFAAIALVASPVGLYLGTTVIASGNSLIFPALLALALATAAPEERASTVSTFSAFFDIATGLGGLTLGVAATLGGYRGSFAGAAIYDVLALVLLRSRFVGGRRPSRLARKSEQGLAADVTAPTI